MRFGVNILNFGPGTDASALRWWTLTAESLGYHFVMISDHVAVTNDVNEHYPAPFYEPFVTLAWLAGITEKVELGTTVAILPYRHPLQAARMVANLDQLSGRRFIFGVGEAGVRGTSSAVRASGRDHGRVSCCDQGRADEGGGVGQG